MKTKSGRSLGHVVFGGLSLAALVWFAGLLSACNAPVEGAPATEVALAQVEVIELEARATVLWDSFTGRVAAPESVELRPRVTGYIERVAFEEGSMVKEGDVLLEIDPRPYRARLDSSAAELARAQSQLELAVSEAQRATKLLGGRAISRELHDQRKAAESAARAAVQAANAELDNARLDLEYTRVKAPISGRVGRALVTRGNLAAANETLLTTVVSTNPMHVYFDGDQQTLLDNPNVLGDIQGTQVQVGLAGERGLPHQGVLDFVDNHLNGQAGTIALRAQVDNSDGRFRAGQFARVRMPTAQLEAALLLDPKAVITDQDRRYVYVLDNANRVQRRQVEPGPQVNGEILIKRGLSAGERVVVNGLHRIAGEGVEVEPRLIQTGPSEMMAQQISRHDNVAF